MPDFTKMTVSELKELAKSLKLTGYEKLKKQEIYDMVMEKMNPKPIITKNNERSTIKKAGNAGKNAPSKDKNKKKKADDKGNILPPGVKNIAELDSGEVANGIFELMEGFGFIRGANFMSGDSDVYVSNTLVKAYKLRTGDMITGPIRIRIGTEKFAALLDVKTINGLDADTSKERPLFEELTPIFPNKKINLVTQKEKLSMRIINLVSPIGKGQRGMIVSPPKAGKTTLIKDIATSISENNKEIKLMILLIDERPEEVTDIRDTIEDPTVDIFYSTFDELPDHHRKVSEMVLHRAKRYVESGKDVVILLDSITRLARAYNLDVPPSGRTLSGGLDPTALHGPKKFFGAARNIKEGGSLTILATALVETGSRMDEVIFEEFKGTGNMELVLDRKLSEKRVYPAIDILKSGTRRDDLLLTEEERAIMNKVRRIAADLKPEEQSEKIIKIFKESKTNKDFINFIAKIRNLGDIYD